MFHFKTKTPVSNLSQPDAVTCQATCLGMAFNDKPASIPVIRAELLDMRRPGEMAGSPELMARWARKRISDSRPELKYELELDASLNDCIEWIKQGEFLITHGWFTGSGHVICIDEVQSDGGNGSVRFSVKDPWGEMDFPRWRYLPGKTFFDGFYSSFGMYAACIAGTSSSNAQRLYKRGELDSNRGGGWIHRFAKKL